MSVFTELTESELTKFLEQFSIGQLVSVKPLHGGTVNSNYHVITNQGEYVLTLLEAMETSLAQDITHLCRFLSETDFPCPKVMMSKAGTLVTPFKNKPCVISSFLKGHYPEKPTVSQCHTMGQQLAKLHLLTQDYDPHIPNTMDYAWREKTASKLEQHLLEAEQQLVSDCLNLQRQIPVANLPHALIHSDLFRDNTLFEGETLSGIIDFYYTCWDTCILDLAVSMNDWCFDENQNLIKENENAMLAGYQTLSPLSDDECAFLNHYKTIMAMHFWLARLETKLSAQSGVDVYEKDPEEYKQKLLVRLELA